MRIERICSHKAKCIVLHVYTDIRTKETPSAGFIHIESSRGFTTSVTRMKAMERSVNKKEGLSTRGRSLRRNEQRAKSAAVRRSSHASSVEFQAKKEIDHSDQSWLLIP